MKQSFKLSRTAISIGEVLFVIAAGLVIPLSPATPAVATVASPALISTTATPTGVLANSPWIADSAGTEWSYGTTTASVGTLLSRNRASGVISPSTVAGGDEGSIAALYSPLTNIAVFSVRRAGSGNRIVTFDLSTGTRLMMRAMATDENNIRALAFNTAAKSVIFGTNTIPAKLIKIDASSGNQQGSVTLASSLKDVTALIPSGTDVLAVTNSTPVKIIPMDRSSMTLGTAVALASTTPMLVDPVVVGTTAYLGTDATPGRITAIDIPTKTVINSVAFATDEIGARNLAVDESTGTLYATTTTANGPRLVSFALATLNRQGFTELGAGSEATSVLFHDHELSVGFSGTRGIGRMTVAPEPASPTTVAITPGDKSLTLSWSAPASIEPILGYTVTASKGTESATCSAATTSCTISGLRNGDSYSVSVVARSIAGASSPTVVTGTPRTVPNAPTIVDVSRGNGSLTATWASAGDGGSAIIDYTATAYPSGRSCVSTGTTCIISGLANGVPQSVRVTARNIAGTSVDATANKTVIPATVPQSINGLTVGRGDREASVTWNPPSSDGGEPVTSYRVLVRLNGRATTELSVTGTSAAITGLTNGSRYDITVSANNTVGSSDESAAVAVTPATTPSIPTNVHVARKSGGATIDWSAPESDGGSPVISYRIQIWDSNSLAIDTASSATSISVSGLTNGKTYRVSISSLNAVGASGPSLPIYVTPATAPSAPRNVVTERQNGGISVTWDAPESDGGDPVTSYRIRVWDSSDLAIDTTSTSAAISVSGLTNGTTYRVSVSALNSAGESAASIPVYVTPATTPSAPRKLSGTRGDSHAVISWLAPSNTGGDAILDYSVRAYSGGQWIRDVVTQDPAVDITGLSNGRRYSFIVAARNSVGLSVESDNVTVTPATFPSPPHNVVTERQNGGISVTWDAPKSDGGDPLEPYLVQVWRDADLVTSVRTTETSAQVTGLTNGVRYRVIVTASNSVGESEPSPASLVTPATTPNKPENVHAIRNNGGATFDWDAPENDGGELVTSYQIRVWDSNDIAVETTSTVPSVSVSGLTNGKTYGVSVTALNSVGESSASDLVYFTPATTPSAPDNVVTQREDGGISVEWAPPQSDGGEVLAAYLVQIWRDADLVTSVSATENSARVTGLTNGVRYHVTVTASNSVGDSDPSEPSFATPASLPGRPESIVADAGDRTANIYWTAPNDDGGEPVTAYRIRVWAGSSMVDEIDVVEESTRIEGLNNGVSYRITVSAINSVGEGLASTSVVIVPVSPPVFETPDVDPPVVDTEEPQEPDVIPDPPVVDPLNPEPPITFPEPPIAIPDPPVTDPPVIDPELPGPPIDDPEPPVVGYAPLAPGSVNILMRSRKWVMIGWDTPALTDPPVITYVVQTSRRKSAGFVVACDVDASTPWAELQRSRQGSLFVRVVAVNAVGDSGPSPTKKVF